ncbi:hypothetical protein VDGL01_05492 [Verticillium dahliae]
MCNGCRWRYYVDCWAICFYQWPIPFLYLNSCLLEAKCKQLILFTPGLHAAVGGVSCQKPLKRGSMKLQMVKLASKELSCEDRLQH